MLFTSDAEQAGARAIAQLAYTNPFLPDRLVAERAVLGDAFDPAATLWHTEAEPERTGNVARIGEHATTLAERARERLAGGARPRADEGPLYDALVLYALYDRFQPDFYRLAVEPKAATTRVAAFRAFGAVLARYAEAAGPDAGASAAAEAAHRFALLFQVRRAFHHIFAHISGSSAPALRLRAAVWQSIFTADPGRYSRTMYARMGDIPTLIVGPTGTGKELVARAIALSRYVPFDPDRQAFTQDPHAGFVPLNLAALSPTLVESELFGHRRGAFTGAVQDRVGWFEACPPLGTVFLDEIGEVDGAIQVKLLRVLQTRTFQRLGETEGRAFQGKLIAATNRDLAAAIAAGRFREDFYYRLCADVIRTPALADQLRDVPGELGILLRALARRIAGDAEAAGLAAEAERWIRGHLPPDYPWPGNVRELEQCVRNILVRGAYEPRPQTPARADPRRAVAEAVVQGTLTAGELLTRYCTLVYAQTGSHAETARRLGLDRRTVRGHVDRAFLATLRGTGGDGPGADGD
jgi:hypothetical protein